MADSRILAVALALSIAVPFLMMLYVMPKPVYSPIEILIFVVVDSMVFFLVALLPGQYIENAFPVKVMIYEKRADSIFIFEDRAKRVQSLENGKYEFILRARKTKTMPVDWKYIYMGKKGQNYLNLYMPQHGEYHPMLLEDVTELLKKITPTPENAKYWYSEQLRRNYERWFKKGGLEKWLPIMMLVVVGVILSLMIYLWMGEANKLTNSIAGIAGSIKDTTLLLRDMLLSVNPNYFNNTNITLPSGIAPPISPVR